MWRRQEVLLLLLLATITVATVSWTDALFTAAAAAAARRGLYLDSSSSSSITRAVVMTTVSRPISRATTSLSSSSLSSSSSSRLYASENETDDETTTTTTTGGLETAVRSKLLAESIAPWRTLRLFFYGSLGSGAALGGFITAAGVAAALSGARTDVDLNTEYLNLAIDFGAVAVFAVLAKFDLAKQGELDERVADRLDKKKEQKTIVKAMRERDQSLGRLQLELTVSTDGTKRVAPVAELQQGAKQHMIIVAGPRKACKDALLGANLLKMDFAMSNILVVPYRTDANNKAIMDTQLGPAAGFGTTDNDDDNTKKSNFADQPFVARTVGDGWAEYIDAEMKDAIQQAGGGNENPEEAGIAIVVANNGQVIRRGIGTVPWRATVEELSEAVTPGSTKNDLVDLPF